MKLEPAFKNIKKGSNNKYNKNQKFPKINSSYNNKSNGKQKLYNFNYNNNQDKNNPYSYFWVNKILNHNIKTIFLTPNAKNMSVSSSTVREILANDGDISAFVPGTVLNYFQKQKGNTTKVASR